MQRSIRWCGRRSPWCAGLRSNTRDTPCGIAAHRRPDHRLLLPVRPCRDGRGGVGRTADRMATARRGRGDRGSGDGVRQGLRRSALSRRHVLAGLLLGGAVSAVGWLVLGGTLTSVASRLRDGKLRLAEDWLSGRALRRRAWLRALLRECRAPAPRLSRHNIAEAGTSRARKRHGRASAAALNAA